MPYPNLEDFRQHTYTPNAFYDYLKGMEQAMSGEVELKITPEETDALEVEKGDMDGYEQEVKVQVVDKDSGEVMRWYNGTLNFQANISSTSGTVAINEESAGGTDTDVDEDLEFTNGELTVKLTYGGTFATADTIKVTVDKDDKDIMGYAVKVQNHDVLDVVTDS